MECYFRFYDIPVNLVIMEWFSTVVSGFLCLNTLTLMWQVMLIDQIMAFITHEWFIDLNRVWIKFMQLFKII